MSALQQAGAAVASVPAGREKIEPRLLGLMESLGVSVANMGKLGTAGVTTISIINCIGVDRQAFIAFIEKEPLDIKSDTVPNTIEQAKVIGVYEAAKSTWQVEMKAASERQVNALPPQLHEMDLDQCVKIFNTAEDEELTDDVIPLKAFLERKIGEITP